MFVSSQEASPYCSESYGSSTGLDDSGNKIGTLGKAIPCATTTGEERHNVEQ
jgi:hypothetical protein